jgi:hypothetical protein
VFRLSSNAVGFSAVTPVTPVAQHAHAPMVCTSIKPPQQPGLHKSGQGAIPAASGQRAEEWEAF